LQASKCIHCYVAKEWTERYASSTENQDRSPVLVPQLPSDLGHHVYHISEYESRESPFSFIRPSPGRGAAHCFLLLQARSCFVRLYKRKGEFRLACDSSSGSHFGKRATCCQKVYQVIKSSGTLSVLFSNLLDPSAHYCSRSQAKPKTEYIPHSLWPYDPPPHVRVGDWNNGRFLQVHQPEGDLHTPHVKPKCPEPEGWELMPGRPAKCTLVGPRVALAEVEVFDWWNESRQLRVTVGPETGIFQAHTSTSKLAYFYDARIMYKTMYNIFQRSSSLQSEYLELVQDHATWAEVTGEPSFLPSYGQFCQHFHNFIKSQVLPPHPHMLPLACLCSVLYAIWLNQLVSLHRRFSANILQQRACHAFCVDHTLQLLCVMVQH